TSPRLSAWASCFAGQLAILTHPEGLADTESAVAAAGEQLAAMSDDAGEATAHTVRALCLARLGRVADCEAALDRALTAARRMLGSARRSLELLGHVHGLLEVDLFSGIVELAAGDAVAAEVSLRAAYDGFVGRGVGVDAAQAAALLARALIAEGHVDEAL